MKTTFIYALKELDDGEFFSRLIRYIGKADDPYHRFEKHRVSQEKSYRGNWIRGLPVRGRSLQLEILDEVPESEWQFWEREYIRVFRAMGFNLVNGTAGGDGVLGRIHSLESRARMSAAWKGKPKPPRSAEYRANISAALKGHLTHIDTRAKISASLKRYYENRQK